MGFRITNAMVYQRTVRDLNSRNLDVDRYSRQSETGDKFQYASEDPVGMSSKIKLSAEISAYTQYDVNAGYAIDSLGLEETALNSIESSLQRANVLMISGENGAYSIDERKAIAVGLSEIKDEVASYMNTRNASGEYIFSGSLGDTVPYTENPETGLWSYQGDSSQRSVNASPSVKVAVSDPGDSIFSVPLPRSVSLGKDDKATIEYTGTSDFSTWYNQNYKTNTDEAEEKKANTLSVSVTGDSYTIKNADGEEIAKGAYSDGGDIEFHGLTLHTEKGYAGGTIELEPPENDNILNTLQRVIDALNDPAVTGDNLREALDRGQIHNLATLQSAGQALGRIGGRSNIAESVISSNDDIRDVKKEARATIAEADSVESAANLIQAQSALSMAPRTFSMSSQTSLMDYIS